MVLSLDDVCVEVSSRRVLSGVSFDVLPGGITALSGPSGCGKTTLLGVLSLLLLPSSGSVSIDGKSSFSSRDRRVFWRERAGFVYQDYGLVDDESVAYNVMLSRVSKRKLRSGSSGSVRRLDAVLSSVGLSSRKTDCVSVLSGGERQRVGIARALFKKADYLFVDEPTASLDSVNRDNVISLLRSAADSGVCVVVATHDAGFVEACDSVVSLRDGKVVSVTGAAAGNKTARNNAAANGSANVSANVSAAPVSVSGKSELVF